MESKDARAKDRRARRAPDPRGHPGPMTGTGTNSYVVGGPSAAVVIDPGPDDAGHRAALIEALVGRRPIAVLVTHRHIDHTAGAASLAADLRAPVLAFGGDGRTEGDEAARRAGA